jgi:putative thioredoxin
MSLNGLDGAQAPGSRDTTTATFRQDVIAESMTRPVLVDFWAPWCGPCKQLTPIIEKAVAAAGGKVTLVKMNIDEHPQIAGQLGIQSIPAVIAFQKGQPVDGFVGALPESQITGFIERLVGPIDGNGLGSLIENAAALYEEGDLEGAADVYSEALVQDPGNLQALAGMAKINLDQGNFEATKEFLGAVPEGKDSDPVIMAVKNALDIAEQAASLGDLGALQALVAANPADYQARFDLALGLAAAGEREAATDHLIEIIKRDRTWQDDGARKQLVMFFDVWGAMDENTKAGRRKLSAVLFR